MLGKKTTEQINAKISSVIGSDMVVEGNVRAKEAVRVEGKVTGDVETEGALIISAGGGVKGNVKGSNIIIGGSVEGDLTSGGRTEVASTGKVIGNIRTKSLIVDENAVFQGQCIMNAEGLAPLPGTPAAGENAEKKPGEESKDNNNNNGNNKWNKR
ncbi:MAG: polymer-forming cytoskeletal protein [Bacteroidales bacterium]|nr:polymer-forming cytoskeletal protein [Bacteroidales bacterium]MCM1415099.1 polymer-forming cytoskeletal protein [bacterium]MCM1423955.1 polymer-forming cytoskeletal protein [bacterium]